MDYMIGEEDVFYDADEDETLDNETESLPTTASGHASTSVMSTVRNSQVFDNDRLEKCGRWLAAIPRDDVITLRQTPEYEEFLEAFDRLGHAHRRVISMNRIRLDLDATMHSESEEDEEQQVVVENRRQGSNFSFLQHLAVDDVILKIFLYIECQALVKTSETCSRFRELAYRSAVQRTQYVANTRQLNNAMQLLRAKEQIDGIGNLRHYFHVRVPMLGLRRRVIVTNAGDPDYNGVYFCTGASSNGFVFTKPRSPERRVMSVGTLLEALPRPPPPPGGGLPLGADGAPPLPQMIAFGPRNGLASNGEGGTHRGQLLKCVIARRFSNDRLLWYMSKEVETISNETMAGEVSQVGEVTQQFTYWASLMGNDHASPDECQYPSQTSVLSQNGGPAWQALTAVPALAPPIVELLD